MNRFGTFKEAEIDTQIEKRLQRIQKKPRSLSEHGEEYHSANMSSSKKIIHSQGREMIYDVYKFMQSEKEQQALTIPLSNLQERVAKACGVGINTVKRIIDEGYSL
ncbi:hypothetical protein JTB14_007080 [Gonioctena quinquepunctata]|nr:hypothetical protein JTB14_007080 [Gonioctena quinquepunctata]